jgi:hypothetical protein
MGVEQKAIARVDSRHREQGTQFGQERDGGVKTKLSRCPGVVVK